MPNGSPQEVVVAVCLTMNLQVCYISQVLVYAT